VFSCYTFPLVSSLQAITDAIQAFPSRIQM